MECTQCERNTRSFRSNKCRNRFFRGEPEAADDKLAFKLLEALGDGETKFAVTLTITRVVTSASYPPGKQHARKYGFVGHSSRLEIYFPKTNCPKTGQPENCGHGFSLDFSLSTTIGCYSTTGKVGIRYVYNNNLPKYIGVVLEQRWSHSLQPLRFHHSAIGPQSTRCKSQNLFRDCCSGCTTWLQSTAKATQHVPYRNSTATVINYVGRT